MDTADYVVMESTYGDRNHEPPESYTGALAALIDEVFSKGGNIIIPSFAVGRTQELLYYLREIKRDGLVQSLPSFKVYVDSPLATEATKIYSGNLKGYLDDDAIAVIQGGENLFTFPGLTLTQSTEESRALNDDKTPKIIISASGMCDAGRIRHHLKHNLWRPECAVVFVGYQGPKTSSSSARTSPSGPRSSTSRACPPTPTGTICWSGWSTSPPGPSRSLWSTGTRRSPSSSPKI